MRSPKEISVGNGWYWLAGAIVALVFIWLYAAVVRPILTPLAWHRSHHTKMQFAEFHLDVPPLWYVPEVDYYRQPDKISVENARLPGLGSSLISLARTPASFRSVDPESMWPMENEEWTDEERSWTKMFGPSLTARITYNLAGYLMPCSYKTNRSGTLVTLSCYNKSTGSRLEFIGTKRDYSKLHEIVH